MLQFSEHALLYRIWFRPECQGVPEVTLRSSKTTKVFAVGAGGGGGTVEEDDDEAPVP